MITALAAIGVLVFAGKSFFADLDDRQSAAHAQNTERLDRAIGQIGETGPDKVDIRLGGIAALEQVMLQSPRDQPIAVEFLTSFIRQHAPKGSDLPSTFGKATGIPADVSFAVTVLGRRDVTHDRPGSRLDLHNTELAGADIAMANLSLADLRGADLRSANLDRTNLIGAVLRDADLGGADLQDAKLESAVLIRADLSEARLTGARMDRALLSYVNLVHADLSSSSLVDAYLMLASLRNANLVGATLKGATLAGADLDGASLSGADLRGTDLSRAWHLTGGQPSCSVIDETTKFPNGAGWPIPGLPMDAGCYAG